MADAADDQTAPGEASGTAPWKNKETAIEPRFQEFFVEAMAIPHLNAPYPRLREAVVLPEPKLAANDGARRRRSPAGRRAP